MATILSIFDKMVAIVKFLNGPGVRFLDVQLSGFCTCLVLEPLPLYTERFTKCMWEFFIYIE